MELYFILILAILTIIIFYQHFRLKKMEDDLFRALKVTCETLNLIKKDATIEEILKMRNKNKFQRGVQKWTLKKLKNNI